MKDRMEAVIFDLNGVITVGVTKNLNKLNNIFNVSLSSQEIYSLWYPVYLEASLGKISLAEFWQRLAMKTSPSYLIAGNEDEMFLEEIQLKENNIPEILSYLKDKYKLGLLSNFVKEWAYMLLERFKLGSFFQNILISSEVGKRKPSPELYQKICELMKVSPRKSVYIADEGEDLKVPQKIGMLPVFIPGEDSCSKIGLTIHSLKELKDIL